MAKQIGIVGAGVSGLLACKYTIEKGFNPIVFEARNGVGGVWSETMESTKLQTPKSYYQFTDFEWPAAADSVTDNFPRNNQVVEYIQSYAIHFNLLSVIKFHSKVLSIHYSSDDDVMHAWDLWGGTGDPFSPTGKWNITVKDIKHPLRPPLCPIILAHSGKFSDLPNIPQFPVNKGPQVFNGKVIHSMDYAAMDNGSASEFIKDKRVTIIGFQKSAVDVAAEVADKNGARYPCTMLFRTVHWTVPENFVKNSFQNLNRFSELMIHKPHEGFFHWFLAIILSPLLWIFSKLVESYLKRIYPLKKYNMVPDHAFFRQISSCMFTVLPTNFYERVADRSLILKKSQDFSFCKNGLIIDSEAAPLESDILIFSTGYKSDQKFANIFASTYFQKCITESSAPFYRECIHPRIPQLAILGYSESPAILYTTEMRSKWLAHFLAGKFKLPTIRAMEEDMMQWEKCMRRYACDHYKRSCVSVLLQIYCNDQLCRDMGLNPRRKSWCLSELFAPYGPTDYREN
ncbi:hypothetical protein LguiB_020265 [Lonicera macranthoides]